MLKDIMSLKARFLAIVLLVLLFHGEQTQGRLVQITTHSNSPCEDGSTCLTLSDCLLNATSCFTSNTTILFPPGDLSTEQVNEFVIVRGIQNIQLLGNAGGLQSTILCLKNVGIGFVDIVNISITNLHFSNCGNAMPFELIKEGFGGSLYVSDPAESFGQRIATVNTAVYLMSVYNVTLSHINISNSQRFGLFAINVLGTSYILHSVFTKNQLFPQSCEDSVSACIGGNVFIMFNDTTDCYYNPFSLMISHTQITQGINHGNVSFYQFYNELVTPAGGISIISRQRTFGVNVFIKNSTIHSNIAPAGGNCALYFLNPTQYYTHVYFINVSVSKGNQVNSKYFNYSPVTGGLFVYSSSLRGYLEIGMRQCSVRRTGRGSHKLFFLKTTFTENVGYIGGAIVLKTLEKCEHVFNLVYVFITECLILNNYGYKSILFFDNMESVPLSLYLTIQKTTISNNNFLTKIQQESFSFPFATTSVTQSTVYCVGSPFSFRITNSTILYNTFTGITFDHVSDITFSEDNYIVGNEGSRGGGILLVQARIDLLASSNLYVENNRATTYGGGIFIEDQRQTCFLNVDSNHSTLIFKNNTALYSGNSIYGGRLEDCREKNFFDPISKSHLEPWDAVSIPWTHSLTEVASDIRQLCFCINDLPRCSIKEREDIIFPGQSINISAVAVGQMNGTVPAIVTAIVAEGIIDPEQNVQELGTVCKELRYNCKGKEGSTLSVVLDGSHEKISRQSFAISITLKVTFKHCPTGFQLNNNTRVGNCECNTFLQTRGITCVIDDQSFQNHLQTWIGFNSKQIIAHDSCPFNKCDSGRTKFFVNDTDLQCSTGHSGILCGGCRNGLSAVFGSSNCLDCSNSFISLILAFLVAGIVLVLVMIYCDLTLDRGTLNGLIFYANIVQVNRTTLFPQGHRNVLTVFIAWFNLDLGIESCFYNGMDAYARTWLQYLFPIYIWVITILIIVACWYSTIAAKICGRNAVAVLATLLLLSYTKLQRTVLESWSFTLVSAHNGSSIPVWLYDGNVAFFGARHAVLFIVAFVAAAAFLIPFTLVLLSEKLLLAKCVRLVIKFKLKPFLDVYHGAYTTKYRWWTGFMLLVRSALILAFSANVLGNPRLNLFFVVIACSGVMCFKWNLGSIYKQTLVNLIESFYLQNLLLLALSTIYIAHNSSNPVRDQAVASYILVSLAFVVFLLIAGYHIFMQIKAFKNSPYWCIKKKTVNTSLPESLVEPLNDMPSEPNTPTVSYVDVRPSSQPEESQGKVRMRRESLLF